LTAQFPLRAKAPRRGDVLDLAITAAMAAGFDDLPPSPIV
jgi:hypothetical protein